MDISFAPMEGITNRIYRAEHARLFPGVDRYYAPFLVACGGRGFKPGEIGRAHV